MKTNYQKQLQVEREKKNRFVDEALKHGTPICKTQEIMKQCKKIDQLIHKSKNEVF